MDIWWKDFPKGDIANLEPYRGAWHVWDELSEGKRIEKMKLECESHQLGPCKLWKGFGLHSEWDGKPLEDVLNRFILQFLEAHSSRYLENTLWATKKGTEWEPVAIIQARDDGDSDQVSSSWH